LDALGGSPGAPEDLRHVCGEAHGKDVDGDSAHDLVSDESHHENGMEQAEQAPDEHCCQDAEPGVSREEADGYAGEGSRQHHAFKADVDDARSL